MSEDRELRELGHLAREDGGLAGAHLDERWERLAAGQLTAEEEAELRALAEVSPDGRDAYEAFRPLGAAFQARMVEAAAAELAQEQAPAAAPAESRPALPFRPPISRLGSWLAAMAAAAAALLASLWLFLPVPAGQFAYDAVPLSGDQRLRGQEVPSRLPGFTVGSTLDFCAKPRSRVEGLVEAHTYLARGADFFPWELQLGPPIQPVDGGEVCLDGTVGHDLRPPPAFGEWRLWMVIARPGVFPTEEELRAKLKGAQGNVVRGRWRAVSQPFVFRPSPSP